MLSQEELEKYYAKYSKEKVDEAINYLSYRHTEPLFKSEDTNFPILYVFRHGQTEDNADFVFSGWRDPDLTEEGVKQAQVLTEKFKDKRIDMLVASDQTRAVTTMKLAMASNAKAKDLEIHQEPRIKERSYGDFQGNSKLLMQLEKPDELLEYRRSYNIRPPQGESIADVVKRVRSFIDEIVPLMKMYKMNVAVSCHGNSIRGFRQIFEGLTDEQTALIETPLGQDYAAYNTK